MTRIRNTLILWGLKISLNTPTCILLLIINTIGFSSQVKLFIISHLLFNKSQNQFFFGTKI